MAWLYEEASPERGIFFRLQLYERVGISLVEIYKRVGKSVISVGKKVTVAKAKNYCIDSKIGTQATIIIREPEKQKTFTLAVFLHFKGNHKSQ